MAVLFNLLSTSWKRQEDSFFFLVIYSQYGPVVKACEKGTFFQLKEYERDSFSVKMVYKRVRD